MFLGETVDKWCIYWSGIFLTVSVVTSVFPLPVFASSSVFIGSPTNNDINIKANCSFAAVFSAWVIEIDLIYFLYNVPLLMIDNASSWINSG